MRLWTGSTPRAELGGQVSGEHGIGVAKRPYLLRELVTPINLQRQIKGSLIKADSQS